MCRVKRALTPYQNKHNSVRDTGEKGIKNHVILTWKLPRKSFSTTHLPFLLPNPKILKAFLKAFSTKMKPTKCPANEKPWGNKSETRGEERKRKVKVKIAVSLLNPKTILKFCFLRMPELCKLIFCIWIKIPRCVRPANGFLVSFSSLKHDSDQKTTRLTSKRVFGKISRGERVKNKRMEDTSYLILLTTKGKNVLAFWSLLTTHYFDTLIIQHFI